MDTTATKAKAPEKETIKDSAEDLVKHASAYAETWYKKTVLQATQKLANAGAGLVNGLIAIVLALIVFFFFNFALAWWLGNLVNDRALGFLILGGVYLVMLIIVISSKKSVLNLFRNKIIRMIYE